MDTVEQHSKVANGILDAKFASERASHFLSSLSKKLALTPPTERIADIDLANLLVLASDALGVASRQIFDAIKKNPQ